MHVTAPLSKRAAAASPLATPPSSPLADVPTPASLDELVALLKAELGPNGLDDADVDVARVCALMERYVSRATDWQKYALFDPCRYTRNLVDDGNGRFNLMILCWGPGHVSPIHDHANAHCCMKLLQGELVETRYAHPAPGRPLDVCGERTLPLNAVAYISDEIGLHRVSNRTAAPAVSLHLYTPPFQTCKTFCERTGAARSASQCVFYSVNGTKCPSVGDLLLKGSCDALHPRSTDANAGSPAASLL